MNYPKKPIEMLLPWTLFPATFIRRPNRFLTIVKFDGKEVESHLPDPGRLKELLVPGASVLVKKESGANRKTRFSTQAVYLDDTLISINSWLPNRFVEFLIQQRALPFLNDWQVNRREFTHERSRFDFLLEKEDKKMFLEVKSVTLVEDGVAKFPDAVTERGARHLNHLAHLSSQGYSCMVLFVVQRKDARLFKPQWERDPKLGLSLVEAVEKGVGLNVIRMEMFPGKLRYMGELPYDLSIPVGIV